jgi:hypothetical protein
MQRRLPLHRTLALAAAALVLTGLLILPVQPAHAAKKQPSNAEAKPAAGVPAASGGAQWTLYCQAIGGPAHVEQAKAVKEKLVVTAPSSMKDWYVIHQDNESVLYYGYYHTISDPADAKDKAAKKEAEKAQRDRKTIAELQDASSGRRIFNHVYFVPIAAPNPEAPPEWNLTNAAAGAYYTLQIAAYKDDPRRKEAAVQAVREARQQGLEAFYYHGETTSSVCIGTWPKAAITEAADEDPEKGIVPASRDPNETMLVLPEQTSDLDQLKVHDAKDGQRIRTYAPGRKIVDPTLALMKEKYPTNAVNGVVYVTKTKDGDKEDPSMIVTIPRTKSSLLAGQQENQPAPALLGGPAAQGSSSQQGGGKLPSLGDK